MIDLHLHTNYSDGKIGVKEMLKMASIMNLDIISITDHDTVDAYKELYDKFMYRNIYNGKVVNGVELSLRLEGTDVHFLVYDYDMRVMDRFINLNFMSKNNKNKYSAFQLLQKCFKQKLIIDRDALDINYDKEAPVYKIYDEIMRHEENARILPKDVWDDCTAFIYKCIKVPDSPYYVDLSNCIPQFIDVAEEIKENSGGKIFLAHPFNYEERSQLILNSALNSGFLDGIECSHSNINKIQQEYLMNLCRANHLLMSGGSDYHAKNEPYFIGLGTEYSNIENELVKDWIKASGDGEIETSFEHDK